MQALKKIARFVMMVVNPPPPRPDLKDPEVRQAWEMVALWDLHPGDEHPTRKGWILQKEIGPNGEPMWFKAHPPWRQAIRPAVLGFVAGCLATVFTILNVAAY
jgi:hypothetical protein